MKARWTEQEQKDANGHPMWEFYSGGMLMGHAFNKEAADLWGAAPEMARTLGNLVLLADAAMKQANRDGAEYDREGELAEARALLARLASIGAA